MTDDELDAALAALPRYSVADDFSDRVMARVAGERTAAERPATARRRWLVTIPLVLATGGAILAGILWTLQHQTLLIAFGQRVVVQAGRWIWDGSQALVGALLRQSAVATPDRFAIHPLSLVGVLALGSLLYLGGVFVLRRLMTAPTSRVAYAQR